MDREEIGSTLCLGVGLALLGVGFTMRGDLNYAEGTAFAMLGLLMVAVSGARLYRHERKKNRDGRDAPRLSGEIREVKDRLLLVVTNHGGPAEVWAQMRVTGSTIGEMTDVYAAWGHSTDVRSPITTGESLNIEIAVLRHMHESLWYVQFIKDGKREAVETFLASSGGPMRPVPLTVTINVFSRLASTLSPICHRLMISGSEWKILSRSERVSHAEDLPSSTASG